MAKEESDAVLVARVTAGDVEAFEVVVERHAERVRRLVSRNVPRSVAAEVAHETFVAAYLSLGGYAATHPFEHWLTRIALRCCADYWRAHSRSVRDERPARSEPSAEMATTKDDRELCEWALGLLEREDREVLTLVYFEELSVKECAAVLSWSEAKVKVRAHRARVHLRRLLRRALGDEE